MQHALVLGASGHVGNAVVRELLARGCRVTAARRGCSDARNLAGLAVCEVLGDGDQAATVDRWIAGHDVVVDAAAPYAMTQGDRGAIAVSEQRARILVETVARHRARLIHIGSFVTALDGDELHPYFAAKRAGEAVFAAAEQAGAPVAIVRPTTCMGPWDCRPRALSLVSRVLAGDVTVAPSHLINVIDVRDVARAVVAIGMEGAQRESLVLSGHNVALSELCTLIGELAGRPVTIRALPPAVARAGAWAIEIATAGSAMPPVPLLTLLALRQTPLSVTAAQRALGASPRPLSVTLRDAIAWYRDDDPCTGAAPGDLDEAAAGDRVRVRRPDPVRTGPVRQLSGAFRGEATGTAGDDPVRRAVRAGCEVIDQAVRRGAAVKGMASEMPWLGAWSGGPLGGAAGPWVTGRWVEAIAAAFAPWIQRLDAWSAMAGGMDPAAHAWATAATRSTPGAMPEPMPGRQVEALDVTVELHTARPAAVQLELSPGASAILTAADLVAPASVAAPPITDVTIARAGHRIVVTLGSLEHHPAATYAGAILAAGGRCGTLTVRLT